MGSIGRWLAMIGAGLMLLAAQPALAASQTICPGVTPVAPAGKVGFRPFAKTDFSWSREPKRTASRDLVLVDLGGIHNASAEAGPLETELAVHPGRYSWLVAFYDKSGRVLCTSAVGNFSIPVPMAPQLNSASAKAKTPDVTVAVHGRYIVVLVGSPYAGRRNLDVDADRFDGGRFKLPKGYAGLEIRGNDNDNIIIGSARSDKIYGYAGNDRIGGGKGNDIIYGGNESCSGLACNATTQLGDTINGGDGDDVIHGGNESCEGTSCNVSGTLGDTIHGGDGNDTIVGGNETCTGFDCGVVGRIGDTIAGGDGTDTIGGGDESCDGDYCGTLGTIGDSISGGAGSDAIGGGNEGCSGTACGDTALQIGDSIDAADGEPDVVDGGGGANVIASDGSDSVTP